ncbi:MAG TPA: YoaK family protein [Pseudonocardiaceae bacterium]|nr:YoaK family protein [Pseudonocardiaceae bacterium]
MAVDVSIDRRLLVGALLGLTAVTGLIDAVSYLRLGHVFVANMTGNVVFLGFTLQPGSGLSAPSSVVAIAGFLVGAVLGGRIGVRLAHRPRLWLYTAFALQAGVLAVVAVLGDIGALAYTGHAALVTIAILGLSFGLQNSTVRRLAAADLTTTVLTLTLTGLAADSVIAGGPGGKPYRRLGSVLAMLAGAAVGAELLRVIGVTGVVAVAAVLVTVIALIFATAPHCSS